MQNDNDHPNEEVAENFELQDLSLHPFTKQNLFNITGRMNRLDFSILWLSLILLTFLIMKYVGSNPVLTAIALYYDPGSVSREMQIGQMINVLGMAALVLVAVRRFHDINYSGWFSLGLIIPFIGLILRLILLFAPGESQANRFGPVPAKNHRNKILILIVVLALIYMIFSSFSQEALPEIEKLLQDLGQNR